MTIAIKIVRYQELFPFSGAWVELAMEFFKVFLIYMGVDLSRADINVAQHRLDEP